MILISLDEGGRFEQLMDPQCMLIGGLTFRCNNEADITKEKRCLEKFFQTICTEQGANYPADLHPLRDEGRIINAEAMGKVKDALSAEMPDYLQMRGRWKQGRPANCNYYVFCMFGDRNGLDDHSAGNLRDNVATVRYDHMIYRTIENLLHFNPYFQCEKDYTLHLPTRVIDLRDRKIRDRDALERELKALGYRHRRNDDGSKDENVFEVTDETSFRTCLESALLNSDRDDLNFNLSVQSINYKKPQFQQMFLYLADTLCSVYQDAVGGKRTITGAAPALQECCRKLVGADRFFLWAYHPIDRKWRSLWKDYAHDNWFEALSTASAIQASRGNVESLYRDIWIRPFEKTLVSAKNFRALSEAVFRLDQYMLDMEKRKQGTGMYVMNLLKENYQLIEDEKERGRLEYRISKIMTGLYNHRGDYDRAQKEYTKCVNAARYVPIEEFLGLQLHYSVSLCDARCYKAAERVAQNLVAHHELLIEIKKEVYPESNTIYDSYARALSQHGQCLCFLGKYDEANDCFREALKIFEKPERDWRVTGSYLLHMLIEQGDRKTYIQEAKDYFGAPSIKKQYKTIMDGKCGSIPFALYVFLKGIWVFEGLGADPDVIKEIVLGIQEFQKTAEPYHPWEQIMKYCAFLYRRYFEGDGKHELSQELMAAGYAAFQNSAGIMKVIEKENEKQYQLVVQGKDYTTDSEVTYTYR